VSTLGKQVTLSKCFGLLEARVGFEPAPILETT
jgi:hypothetical protein